MEDFRRSEVHHASAYASVSTPTSPCRMSASSAAVDAATASSQSSLSSQFDDTDTEDAEEVMTRPHMPTSLDDLSYEPVSNKRVN